MHCYSDSPMNAPQRPDARQAHSEPLIDRIGELRSGVGIMGIGALRR
jgi:hypothetical protein